MRLEWKTFRIGEDRSLELEVAPFLLLLKDEVRGVLRVARLSTLDWPESVTTQLHFLLAEFKRQGSTRETLTASAVVADRGSTASLELCRELKAIGVSLSLRLLDPGAPTMARLSLFDGSLWLPKKEATPPPVKAITKVLIVEDSLPVRKILEKAYGQIAGVQIVGVEGELSAAIAAYRAHAPDFVSLDMKIEGGTGLDFLKAIELRPADGQRCVLVTDLSAKEGNLVLEAFENGASSYIQKPQAADLEKFSSELRELIGGLFEASARPAPRRARERATVDLRKLSLVAIGSSTGGTEIVRDLIRGFPEECPPILVVQHMPEQFTGLYADRIARQTGRKTFEVRERMLLEPGAAYIAAGGLHMTVEKRGENFYATAVEGEPVNRFKPSVSVLFDSILEAGLAPRTLALMLTGMGRDGAAEMLKLKNAGAMTIGQSRESCVVYGMPRAAEELGALRWSASPEEILRAVQSNFEEVRRAKI